MSCSRSLAQFLPRVWLAAAVYVSLPKLEELIRILLACFGGVSLGDAWYGNRRGLLGLGASSSETGFALLCRVASGSFCPLILFVLVGRCL